MKNKTLVAILILLVISTSMFAGKLKGKVISPGDKGMISIGGGTNLDQSLDRLFRFDANVYVPLYFNKFMSFGFNAGGNYNSFSNDFQTLPTVYNMANLVTNTAAFVGDVAAKKSGFTLQVGPQANFHVGNNMIISSIIGFGLSNMYQPREYKAVQTTNTDIKTYTYDLLKVKETATNGLCMTPKVRLNYMISSTVGFWTEGSYLISPSVSRLISTFKPEGVADIKGNYKEQQLALGTYTTQTVTQSYNAVGVNAGITIVLGGVNYERKGIKEGGIRKTEEMAAERKGWDGSIKGIAERKGINENGLKKTENIAAGDGSTEGIAQRKGIKEGGLKKTEEIVERKGWDGSIKGIAERKGINENGLKKTENIAADPKGWDGSVKDHGGDPHSQRKGWDGTVKGGSIQGKGITQSGIKRTEEMTVDPNSTDVSNVGSLAGGGSGAAAASYAATGRMASGSSSNDSYLVTYTKISDNQLLISGIDVNGTPFEHAINTKGTGGTIARTAQNSDNGDAAKHAINSKGSGGNLVKTQNPANNEIPPSCGSVNQKITYPDGTVEENTFACPADAVEYQQLKNVTVSKQTQGATFGEKVNAGLHQAGSQVGQGASIIGGALPGGAVISAANTVQNGNSGEQPSSISNVLKTKHDTSKNSVGNIRRLNENPDTTSTDSPAARKGWDGTVKGGSRGIDKADIRKNASNQRKGWDGSVKGGSKGIKENGIK